MNQTPEEELNKIKLKHHWKIMYDKRWNLISRKEKLSEEFIEKYQKKVDWHRISLCQTLSEEFIEKFQDKVNWKFISKHQNLSQQFIEVFKRYLNIDVLLQENKITQEFYNQLMNPFNNSFYRFQLLDI